MELTPAELNHCDNPLTDDWKKEFNYAGGFQTQLMLTIMKADGTNQRKLATVYPNLVALYRKTFTGVNMESDVG